MPDPDDLSEAKERLKHDDYSGAEEICHDVLLRDPENAQAWHLCGISHAQRDCLDMAVDCFEKATSIDGDNAVYHYNLGLAYRGMQQLEQAVKSYREALARKEDFLEARNNLGNALIDLGEDEAAIKCFRVLLELFPDSCDGHFNLGNLLQDTDNFVDSIAHYRRAVELDPHCSVARENLGRALADEGRIEEACQVWQSWLDREPNNAVARHMLVSMSGQNAPKRCDDAYIRATFNDEFAKTFDSQLARIHYRAPELVGDAFESVNREMANLDVLDAGCGTGLCGPVFRAVARRLVGVDLSADMLIEARKRKIYDETIACEISEFMRSQVRSFDLIVSADTLCYFGDLGEVLISAFECLKDNGTLIFTVETADFPNQDQRYELKPHGRYCHARHYVTDTLRAAGFAVLDASHAVLRKERGRSVGGLVVTASRDR